MPPADVTPDITAVVLTVGEPSLPRALASLAAQTLPPAEIIEVRDMAPFHAALNHGARQVRTEFLVQLDADMVLDPDCLATLRGIMTDDMGLVRAMRRDPLLGRDSSFKLYRTQCFREADLPDTVSSDVDFRSALMQRGWLTATALRFGGSEPALWHTFLDHLPDYTPRYTFEKYLAEGSRYRQLSHPRGLRWKLGQLRRVGHPLNLHARLGLGRGLFLGDERETSLGPARAGEFDRLEAFLARRARPVAAGRPPRALRLWARAPLEVFRRAEQAGRALAERGTWDDFAALTEALARRSDPRAWLAQVGLATGLCTGLGGPAADERVLSRLVAP